MRMNFTQALSMLVNASGRSLILCGDGHHEGHECDHEQEHEHGAHDMNMDMDMKMWFHFGHSETVLFEQWRFDSDGELIASVVGIFFLALFYEVFKVCRELFNRMMQKHNLKQTMFNPPHMVETLMHAVQFILSYFLMFIFMTFNVWLCLALVFGSGVGYFLFGWRKTSIGDPNEHCH